MEVLLLGTGAADGWPSPFCTCLSCADSRARGAVRQPTAALLDATVLVDAGPGVPAAVARAGRSLRDVHHVLVTHAHTDHLDPALLLWLSWNPTPHTVHIWGPPSVIDACRDWIGPKTPAELHEIAVGDNLDLAEPQGTWRVRVLAASHDADAFGGSHDALAADAVLFDITHPRGHRLLYATDTGPLPPRTIHDVSGAAFDIVLIEETFGDHVEHRTGHLDLATLPQALAALRDVGALMDSTDVVAVHLSHHNPPEGVLRARLADMGVRLVDDGFVLGRTTRTLIVGGARSGKSAEAERRALEHREVVYVATADERPGDAEWAERVAIHRARRPASWRTVEGPGAVFDAIARSTSQQAVIVDCLTLWLTGVLDNAADGLDWDAVARDALRSAADSATKDLVDAIGAARGTILIVSNEVGMGIIPATPSGRLFADLLGRVNQAVGRACDETVLMVAGQPLALRGARGR